MSQILVNQNEYLAHSRTKGSKNGVRRYQYENGRLTPEGIEHYGKMYGWGQSAEDYGNIAKTANNTAKTVTETGNRMYKDYRKGQYKNEYREQARHLSDDELKRIVKRKEWEDKYVNAMTPEVKSGADKALQALEIVGAIATTAVAVGQVAKMFSSHMTTTHGAFEDKKKD